VRPFLRGGYPDQLREQQHAFQITRAKTLWIARQTPHPFQPHVLDIAGRSRHFAGDEVQRRAHAQKPHFRAMAAQCVGEQLLLRGAKRYDAYSRARFQNVFGEDLCRFLDIIRIDCRRVRASDHKTWMTPLKYVERDALRLVTWSDEKHRQCFPGCAGAEGIHQIGARCALHGAI